MNRKRKHVSTIEKRLCTDSAVTPLGNRSFLRSVDSNQPSLSHLPKIVFLQFYNF